MVGNFKWNSQEKGCFCDIGYYLDGGICKNCPTVKGEGMVADTLIDGFCGCKFDEDYVWIP
jgi:hypothetical protein